MLCEEELVRAERFRFPFLRRRFVAGRGALRAILAEYLSVEPQKLTFSYSAYGKPSLLNTSCNIQFNVSHSNDLMVAAICREWPIGVDIEKEEPRFHAMDIAAKVLLQERERRDRPAQRTGQSASVFPILDSKRSRPQGDLARFVARTLQLGDRVNALAHPCHGECRQDPSCELASHGVFARRWLQWSLGCRSRARPAGILGPSVARQFSVTGAGLYEANNSLPKSSLWQRRCR